MEPIGFSSKLRQGLVRYRTVLIVLLVGVFLMLLPGGGEHQEKTEMKAAPRNFASDLQTSLGDLLSQMEGAGEVQVLLTEAEGSKTVYEQDEEKRDGEIRREPVLTTGADRSQTGLVRQVDPPVYQGAIVLCQGAGSAAVRLQIVKAVADATGLTSDRVTVLKMK